MLRILGIDPGLRHTGWGVVTSGGGRLGFVDCGVISPAADMPLAARLQALHDGLAAVIAEHRPDSCAMEETFVSHNAATTLKLGQARGALLLTVGLAGLPVHEYAARLVKKSVTGTGRADKNQIIAMMGHLLPGAQITSPDAADALAVALCHAHHGGG